MDKKIYYIASSIGTFVGGYIPTYFGADGFSPWSILGGGIGGILAIVIVYRLSNR